MKKQKSTEGMVDYNDNSSAQQQMVQKHGDILRGLVDRLEDTGPEMRIVDYGCGPGRSTIEVVRPSIEAYRLKNPEGPIAVCHADQPGNDWNALFNMVYGPSGYLNGQENIRTEAAVGSFYNQMAPAGSVSIATCFAASHWLSQAVHFHTPETVWFADIENADTRAKMWALAERDWTHFLRLRALELRPGGFLLVSSLGSVPDPDELNGAAASGRGVYRALQDVAADMAKDGLVDRKVLDRFLFALWFLTEEEAGKPLEADPELEKAFESEIISVVPGSEDNVDFFGHLLDDPVKYGTAYMGYIRAFADSTLRTQLFEPSAADKDEVEEIAAEFYKRLEKLYERHLSKYAFEIWHMTVLLRRR